MKTELLLQLYTLLVLSGISIYCIIRCFNWGRITLFAFERNEDKANGTLYITTELIIFSITIFRIKKIRNSCLTKDWLKKNH